MARPGGKRLIGTYKFKDPTMFLPHEIANFKTFESPALMEISEKIEIVFGNDKRTTHLEIQSEDKYFYSPKAIYGVPFNTACLNGVHNYNSRLSPVRLYSLAMARIIGPNALISENNLYWLEHIACAEKLLAAYAVKRSRAGFFNSGNIIKIKKSEAHKSIEGNSFFVSDLEPDNFGSFNFRALPQLILLKSLDIEIDFFIIPDSNHWTISGLTTLFPNAKFVTYKSSHHYIYKNLFYFSDFSNEGLFDNAIQTLLSETIYKYFIFPFKSNSSLRYRKIFLSRRASSLDKPNYRPLTNEGALERIAIDNGYQVIYPEQYSLAMQYQIIGEAQTIITTSGSNCCPLLFNSNKPKVLHLESFTQTVRQAYKIFASASCEYHGLFGKIHNPSQPIWSSWEVDPSVFSFALSNLCD